LGDLFKNQKIEFPMLNHILQKVKPLFESEFAPVSHKFVFISSAIKEAYDSQQDGIANPGVYIFWKDNEIVKVGRHLTNSRKRALQHIRDNTRNEKIEMKDLPSLDPSETGILFINCKDSQDYHWVAALEIFLEVNLDPVIKSGRVG
jgi:hypothetical protein